jgi:hypothetical protein
MCQSYEHEILEEERERQSVCVCARARVRVVIQYRAEVSLAFLICFQDEGQLLKLQKMLEEKGDSARGIKKQLFILYCRNKDLQKVEQMKKVMYFVEPSYFKIHRGPSIIVQVLPFPYGCSY